MDCSPHSTPQHLNIHNAHAPAYQPPPEIAQYQANEGIFTKAHVLLAAKTMPPATWWATFGKHLPFISAVAQQVLAQPVCASSARERNWSVYGKIKTAESKPD